VVFIVPHRKPLKAYVIQIVQKGVCYLLLSFYSSVIKHLFSCRNFPQGTISDMIADSSQGIAFVCNNIAEYGGDPNR